MKKHLFLILSLFTLFYSCAETDNGSSKLVSCSGITCSGHGICDMKDNSAYCKCDEGYINMGAECVFNCSAIPNSVPNIYNNGCSCPGELIPEIQDGELISCGCEEGSIVKGSKCLKKCEDPNAYPLDNNICVCKEGYYKDATGTCKFDCRNIEHAYTNTDNTACVCEEGYEFNKNGYCEYSCNKAGNMQANSSNTGCECKENYFPSNEIDLCLNPCDDITCGNTFECKAYDFQTNLCECGYGTNLKLKYTDKVINTLEEYTNIKIATNNGNGYIVVWVANTSENDNIKSIYAMLLDAEGNIIKPPFTVNSRDLSDTQDKINPVVTFGNGKYLVAWEDLRFSTNDMTTKDIYYKLIPENGEISGIVEKRLTFTRNNNTYAWGIKALWNEAKSHFAIFWKERKRDTENNLGETIVYYRLINPEDDSFLSTTKQTTISNISVSDYDVTVNKNNNYSMVWIKSDSPKRIYYQVLASDISVMENEGVIIKEPFNLIYNDADISAPKIITTQKDYSIFFKNSNYSRRYMLLKLNFNHIKEYPEKLLNFSDTIRDIIYNGNDFIFTTNYNNELYIRNLSFNGSINNNTKVTDGYGHTYQPRVLFINGNYKVFWLDDRNGDEPKLYMSELGCYK